MTDAAKVEIQNIESDSSRWWYPKRVNYHRDLFSYNLKKLCGFLLNFSWNIYKCECICQHCLKRAVPSPFPTASSTPAGTSPLSPRHVLTPSLSPRAPVTSRPRCESGGSAWVRGQLPNGRAAQAGIGAAGHARVLRSSATLHPSRASSTHADIWGFFSATLQEHTARFRLDDLIFAAAF